MTVRDVCSVAGCDREAFCRTWCQAHYARWKTHGDVQANKPVGRRRRRGTVASCSVEGCDRQVMGRGWCRTHYQRWRTTGDVQGDVPIGKPRRSKAAAPTPLVVEPPRYAGPLADVPPRFVSPPAGTVLVPVPVDVAAAVAVRARQAGVPSRAWVARQLAAAALKGAHGG